MVVSQLHIPRLAPIPAKANPVLVVHPDAVLSCPVTLERFQPVTRRNAQVIQCRGSMQQPQSAQCNARDGSPFSRGVTVEQRLGLPIPKGTDHSFLFYTRDYQRWNRFDEWNALCILAVGALPDAGVDESESELGDGRFPGFSGFRLGVGCRMARDKRNLCSLVFAVCRKRPISSPNLSRITASERSRLAPPFSPPRASSAWQ